MKKLVVLTGAGISAESGLATFRDQDGLWNGYQIEDVATPRAFERNPQLVLDFYNYRRQEIAKAQPNAAHNSLVDLQEVFDVHIITQNIDDLHERAGSKKVLHLHGEIFKKRSVTNANLIATTTTDINLGDKAPDNGQWRPHIVWFEEPVPMMQQAELIVSQADVFVIIGTSLVVYPAAGLQYYAPQGIPKYLLDRHIPITNSGHYHCIEKPATQGVAELVELLKKVG
jgi:NAD-dependent deacetylase